MSAIKIVADVERSADLCVNICKAARRIYGHQLDPHLRGVIQKMGDQAQALFKEATEAYLNLDGPRAAALRDMDSYLDDLHRQFIADHLREPRRRQRSTCRSRSSSRWSPASTSASATTP